MATTLNDIQIHVAAVVDQSVTPPTAGGSESELRKSWVNRAIQEWGEAYDWEGLRKTKWLSVTGVSQGSLPMPADFRKMARMPVYYSSGIAGGEEWSEIIPDEIGIYDSTDKYFYMLGDRGNGNTMIWNPATIASGASMMITYFSFPTSVVSPADIIPLGNPEFLVNRTIAYIFEARSDSRFQGFEARARENLLGMIDNQNDKSRAFGENDNVKTREEKYWGFRIGRD
jgi:hypothetical protein